MLLLLVLSRKAYVQSTTAYSIKYYTVAIGPAGSLLSLWRQKETNSYPALTLTLDLANVTLPNRRRPD